MSVINRLGTNLYPSGTACVTLLPTGHVGFELMTLPLQQGPELLPFCPPL